ncbi:MFS transporter [Fictibacillus sp. WQ 8-8]|uniref:MFS transporter n=1 Tax=Fictibacillus marinisediminis TaxID=2878389 RepID=A0A9X1X939_9BACL|nr:MULTISPECIES: MFS transporter [Fictibacillus]MCK6256158.1 MFS transporter [Fictibacillus marinisediminis]MCQ6267726.1 MFS transporter [Fictibacillus sp. WQ 8-8]MED2974521.1 MFS transporter [Fictibacillus sp. B-59209]SFE33089.1 Predicted arabinose efflux permease, MFS family [Bacillus sp. OV194]
MKQEALSIQEQPSKQPLVIWVIFFATIISFMGLGLVDPILPAIAHQLNATPSQVSLLFSSYNLITGIAMLITGVVSSRVGIKWTLLSGILLIIVFSALAGSSNEISQIVGFRGGWGLGNSLFIATALSAIVGLSIGGTAKAIILYEAAIGLGISVGPLLGGELGSISWRGPFYGVSVLMVIAFFALLLKMPHVPKPKVKSSVLDPIKALKYPGLLRLGLTAFLYNIGFFTLMAYSPFVMNLDEHGLGYVFLGWGLCLAITSVFVAPKIQARFGTVKSMCAMLILFALTLLAMGIWTESSTVVIVAVIVAGLFLGTNNTLITTAVMQVAPVERATASAAYSFVRFIGGAIGPWLANKLAETYSPHVPFVTGAIFVLFAMLVVAFGRKHLAHVDSISH